MKYLLISLMLVACSANVQPVEEVQKTIQEEPETTTPECNVEGAPKQCYSNEDCCPGFECSKDPQGSVYQLVCVFAG